MLSVLNILFSQERQNGVVCLLLFFASRISSSSRDHGGYPQTVNLVFKWCEQGFRPLEKGLLDVKDGIAIVVGDTQSDSIQCLNFANKGFIQYSIQYCFTPRRSSVANAGGRPFCQELGMGWVHIGQWIFSISAISHELFWRNCVFCVFTL